MPNYEVVNDRYEELPIELIDPHPMNPNRGDLAVIDESIRVNGYFGAITVREKAGGRYEIIGGEHRWKVMKEAGALKIPAIVVTMNDVQAAVAMLVDNEAARHATYDGEKLSDLLESLGSIEGTGFDLSDLADFEEERQILEQQKEELEKAEAPEVFGLLVLCETEREQDDLARELQGRDYEVKKAAVPQP